MLVLGADVDDAVLGAAAVPVDVLGVADVPVVDVVPGVAVAADAVWVTPAIRPRVANVPPRPAAHPVMRDLRKRRSAGRRLFMDPG